MYQQGDSFPIISPSAVLQYSRPEELESPLTLVRVPDENLRHAAAMYPPVIRFLKLLVDRVIKQGQPSGDSVRSVCLSARHLYPGLKRGCTRGRYPASPDALVESPPPPASCLNREKIRRRVTPPETPAPGSVKKFLGGKIQFCQGKRFSGHFWYTQTPPFLKQPPKKPTGANNVPPPCVTFRLVVAPLRGLDGHPFFPSHVALGCCVLSAAAAGAPAGVVSAFAEPVFGVLGLC